MVCGNELPDDALLILMPMPSEHSFRDHATRKDDGHFGFLRDASAFATRANSLVAKIIFWVASLVTPVTVALLVRRLKVLFYSS